MYDLKALGERAREAKATLRGLKTEEKNRLLLKAAEQMVTDSAEILQANVLDLTHALENGMSEAMQDRLRLTDARIEAMAEGMRQVAELPDPVGCVLEEFDRPNGLHISKVSVPLGVIGIIFESRPNVCADAFALTFKAGNAVILKGGSDALETNKAIIAVIRKALAEEGITEDAVSLIESTDREVTKQFMKMKEYVDVLIPRGGAGLIRSVVENATIPVIETGTGNCHVYVDRAADLEMAVRIVKNAKTQRISVCNAAESLILHRDIKDAFMPMLQEALKERPVEFRGDEEACAALPGMIPATEEDYGREYLDYIMSVKTVGSTEEAIRHINRYNTHHSETIVTEDPKAAEQFLNGVDAACVYVNASTRFTDGFEFGFGAEIGISTQMLHARGPMGLRELTSYQYQIRGNGQIRG
ncbi:MAG: glutamate-5-semialdehyde dehydrogenase [Lachnospiraceae bacterium]|nr:glutamate-5-semialdehyde dehydrogenase [Lachnospiraceae bacterium]